MYRTQQQETSSDLYLTLTRITLIHSMEDPQASWDAEAGRGTPFMRWFRKWNTSSGNLKSELLGHLRLDFLIFSKWFGLRQEFPCFLSFKSYKITLLRVIPTLAHNSDIVSGTSSGIIYGIYMYIYIYMVYIYMTYIYVYGIYIIYKLLYIYI